MEKNTGRLLKQASNQLGRQFDKFAKQYELTGTQMSIIDFLSHKEKVLIFNRILKKNLISNAQQQPFFCSEWRKKS